MPLVDVVARAAGDQEQLQSRYDHAVPRIARRPAGALASPPPVWRAECVALARGAQPVVDNQLAGASLQVQRGCC